MLRNAVFFGAPFHPPKYAPLPLGAILPSGWLKRELQTHMEGLTGKLHKFWPDVGEENGWLGGEGHAWERGPYYMDGYLSLAWQLRNDEAIAHAKRFIEWTLSSQREDGFFGPASNDDWWPRSVMLKVVWQYYTATNDSRVPTFMLKFYKYMEKNYRRQPPKDWAKARAMEFLCTLAPLYGLTGKQFLVKLAKIIVEQSLDWTQNFHAFPYSRPSSEMVPWDSLWARRKESLSANSQLSSQEQRFTDAQYHFTHIVNNAMAIKYPSLQYAVTGNIKAATASEEGFEKLMRYHGVAIGLFTGDEHINGASPSRGTETCAVVEAMHSFETLAALTGKAAWGDRLEKLAFSALPAAISPDRMGHQYLQQVNQVRCTHETRDWYNNGDDANLFGLEPNFGCCTANRHQGWPRFVQSLWMASPDGGLAAMAYAPCRIVAAVGENHSPIRLNVDTEYPWREEIVIRVRTAAPVTFPMRLRIPAWAEGATLSCGGMAYDATPGDFAEIEREFRDGDEVRLVLPMKPRVFGGYHQSIWVERGPALYALQLAEEWRNVSDHPFAPTYEVQSTDEWRYALFPDSPIETEFSNGPTPAFKQGEPPVRLRARARLAPEWKLRFGSAAPPPVLPETPSSETEITLVPYGFTSLRVTQFPQTSPDKD